MIFLRSIKFKDKEIIINKYKIASVALTTPSIFGRTNQTVSEKIMENKKIMEKINKSIFSIALVLLPFERLKAKKYIIKINPRNKNFPNKDISRLKRSKYIIYSNIYRIQWTL
tara:strand:+ start:374 stop:712 length:339 start_codon:yes stop_codon:yes gene_type:complete